MDHHRCDVRSTAAIENVASMVTRLRERQTEIDALILRRARSRSAVADADAGYATGLREAVSAVLDYGLTWVEHGEKQSGPVPPAAIEQARRAARKGTTLETVILSYIAGYRIFASVVRDEADRSSLSGDSEAQRTLGNSLDALLEHLVMIVAEEYQREFHRVLESAAYRRQQVVQRLLAGETVDDASASLDYNLDDWHLGFISVGPSAARFVQALAKSLECRLLQVSCGEQMIWAWLGGCQKLCPEKVEGLLVASGTGLAFATGEPGAGLSGWRQTHEEAQAALRVALRHRRSVTRCADVPLEAALLRDDAAAASLLSRYLEPLDRLRMGGCVARETLRAYFECERNVSSAAHRLGVRSRHTITERLRRIDEALDCPLQTCYAELEVALRLEALGCPGARIEPIRATTAPKMVGCHIRNQPHCRVSNEMP
jgi:hypothetical protein